MGTGFGLKSYRSFLAEPGFLASHDIRLPQLNVKTMNVYQVLGTILCPGETKMGIKGSLLAAQCTGGGSRDRTVYAPEHKPREGRYSVSSFHCHIPTARRSAQSLAGEACIVAE